MLWLPLAAALHLLVSREVLGDSFSKTRRDTLITTLIEQQFSRLRKRGCPVMSGEFLGVKIIYQQPGESHLLPSKEVTGRSGVDEAKADT